MILAYSVCLMLIFSIRLSEGFLTSCVHGGTTYQDGDFFPPNKTFIETRNPFECVQCRCNRGLVVCEIENCTVLECGNPIKHSQFCCPRCPEITNFDVISSDFGFGVKKEESSRKIKGSDCVSNGQNYAEGSEWQPIIGPLGAMACVRCRCRGGNILCTRLQCDDQPCSHPKRRFGECCPVCPTSTDEGNRSKSLCLPKSSEIFVFKTSNVQNDTEKIQYGFVENSKENQAVTLCTWNFKPKTSEGVLKVQVSAKRDLERSNLELLGSVTQKRFKKFMQRGEKLQSKCSPVQCLKKLKRLENSLGIRRTFPREKCADDEMEV